MKKYRILLVASAITALFSCSRELDPQSPAVEMTVTASCESGAVDTLTKTSLSTTTVRWTSGDAISLYSSDGAGSKFTATKVSSNLAYFSGTIVPGNKYYGVYPSDNATLSGNDITATLPTTQTAKANSFGAGANLAVAYTASATSPHLDFKNVGGLLQVIVRNTNIKKIRFEATEATGHSMTGQAVLNVVDGVPVLKSTSGSKYVELTGTIQSGVKYYLVVYPGNYSNVTLTFTDADGRNAVYKNAGMNLEVKRNSITKIADITIPESKFDDDIPIYVKQIFSSPSTVTVSWTTFKEAVDGLDCVWPNKATSYETYRTQDGKKDFTLTLYSDAACSNQIVKYVTDYYYATKGASSTTRIFDSNYPTRFTFSGLNPSTTYYLKIENRTDKVTMKKPLALTTCARAFTGTIPDLNAKVGDVILFESFDKCLFGGDIVNFAAGYSRYDRGSSLPSDLYSVTAKGTIPGTEDDNFYQAYGNVEVQLFSSCANILDEMGLDSWSTTLAASEVLARPGSLKIGASSKKGSVVTPVLKNIPSGYTATVKVSFKASPYTSAKELDPAEKDIILKVLTGGSVSSYVLTGFTTGQTKQMTISADVPGWQEYSVELSGVSSSSRIEIASNRATSGQSRFHLDDVKIEILSLEDYTGDAFKGTVKDNSGIGIEGVVVTDGYTCVKTRSDGSYIIPYNSKAEFIYITVPAEYNMTYDTYGFQNNYIKADGYSKSYNFTLTPLSGGKQTTWNLCVLADPQTNPSTLNLFKNEVAPDIKTFVKSYSNMYGVILGDICWNSPATHVPNMRDALKVSNTGVNWCPTIGNHDWYRSDSDSNPSDATYKTYFGPTRYSFDRGDVHVICMNNCITAGQGSGGACIGGFSDDEYNWLCQDVSQADKSKAVILCTHIAFRGGVSEETHCVHYTDTRQLLVQFAKTYLFSGHSHYNYWHHHTVNGKHIYEHVHTAGCGGYWHGKLGCDGSPYGYTIYTFNGKDIENYQLKNVGYDKSSQIRCYDGNASINGYMAPYGFQYEKGTIVANVYMGDNNSANKWTVELYQNGVKCCDMVYIANTDTKTVSKADVVRFDYAKTSTEVENNYDWFTWNQYIETGTGKKTYSGSNWTGRRTSTSYQVPCCHLWRGKLTSVPSSMSSANFEVRATDPYGNVYTCSTLTPYQSSAASFVWR